VLLGALVVPAIAAPQPVSAWSGTVTCSATDLHFRVYAGVPTYLLGFIPLDDGQTLTLTHTGGFLESAGWTVTDDAGWLNEDPLLGVVGCIDRNQDVTVRVNTDGLVAGTYTATITFKFTTCATKTITVPVTVDVIEPKIMGPLGIGMLNIFDTSTENYGGLAVQLLTNPDNAMDMQAIETDGCWNLVLQRGDEIPGSGQMLSGGTLDIEGETTQIAYGQISPISALMSMMGGALPIPADFDWGENYVAIFSTSDGTTYIGLLLGDIGKLLDLLPMLGDMFSTEEGAGTDINGAPPDPSSTTGDPNNAPTVSEDMVIPLAPILDLLPTLMPVMMDLLSNETVLNILKPLMGLLPPIMIVLPATVMVELFSGLMP